ncbi:MAG TPA: DUF4280 domain-containing protein [Pseudomonadota bacterium]|nr:DUF4280 domain-containing protein [Pseudomonadota bacterium]
MGAQVCMGAVMMCSFGAAPSSLVVIRPTNVSSAMPAANIMDMAPIANIPPFGVCTSLSNPTVAAATAAALGVLTPMPCVPVTPAPWVPGVPKVMVGGMPALDSSSKQTCAWGGVIQISVPGQFKETL